MVRGVALLVGLLAAAAGCAGEMSADEARRFVIGKMFTYTCFEGTRGQGRVIRTARWSAPSNSTARADALRALPAGTLQVKGEAVCASLRGLPIQPCFNLERTSDNSFRGSISGLVLPIANSRAIRAGQLWSTACSDSQYASARPAAVADRRQQH